MNILKYYINAMKPIVGKDGRIPISQTALADFTQLTLAAIRRDLDDLNEDVLVTKGLNGTYTEVKILKPLEVPKFLFMEFTYRQKEALLYFYENNLNKFDIKDLDYKKHKQYFGPRSGQSTFYSLQGYLENLTHEDLFEPVSEEDKREFNVGDNVEYEETNDSFIYAQRVKREPPTEEAILMNFFANKWKSLLGSANKRRIEMSITLEELREQFFKQESKCYYTGKILSLSKSLKKSETPSVDRIDNTKGYTKENIVFCLNVINSMKSDQTLDEFLNNCKLVYNNLK